MAAAARGPVRSRFGRRLLRRTGWIVGAPLAVFRFLRQDIVLRELPGAGATLPLPLPPEERSRDDGGGAGVGALSHKVYRAVLRECTLSAERLIRIIAPVSGSSLRSQLLVLNG